MAKGNIIQTNFTAGELSPRMDGRVDVVRFQNGAKRIENCFVLVQGGCLRRPGLEYMAPAKSNTLHSRLIPYVFNVGQSYHLELSQGVIRVFTANGALIESSPGVPLEIPSPYTESQLLAIDFCQRADTMLLFHENVPTYRLQRLSATQWRMGPVPWVTEPFDELGDVPGANLNLYAVSGAVTATASSGVFSPADVGRTIDAGGGSLTITGYTSATVVTGTVTATFPSTGFTPLLWTVTGSPQSTVTPSAVGPVGTNITLTASTGTWHTWDVGRYVVIDGGLVKINGYTSATMVQGEVREELSAAVAAPANAWALCRSMWGQEFGYPRTGAFYQQRLWAGGSPGFPQSTWMSRLGEYFDFEIGSDADAGFETRIDSDQANPIRHLAASRALSVLSLGQEFTIAAAGDGGIKPGNIDANAQSAYGCNDVAPIRYGSELLFVGQSGRKIRAFSPDRFDNSTFAAPDLTVLSEHITYPGIIDMDAMIEPDGLVMTVRADGQMVVCTLDRDNDVVAFCRYITDGVFESISVAPYLGESVAMCVVRRTINGVQRRSIEAFRLYLLSDSAILATSGTPFNTVSGLGHLEGKTVIVRADDIYVGEFVVVGGSVTIDRTALRIEVGLPFIPLVELMPPEMQGPWGTSQGLLMRTIEASLLVLNTAGCNVNGRDVVFPRFGADILDQPQQLFTGWERIEMLGYERGVSEIIITQPRPLPFFLQAVRRELEVSP